MTAPRLDLARPQVLAHRRRAGALDERLQPGSSSLERAAWAGLQDSMPRAALLSIHARVAGTESSTWEDPSLAQVWGPRFNAYVVAARDRALFTLGRLPDDAKGRRRAEDTAARLHAFLDGRRMRYDEAGQGLGVHPNALRYAGTGSIELSTLSLGEAATGGRVPPAASGRASADAHRALRDLPRLRSGRRLRRLTGYATGDDRGVFAHADQRIVVSRP